MYPPEDLKLNDITFKSFCPIRSLIAVSPPSGRVRKWMFCEKPESSENPLLLKSTAIGLSDVPMSTSRAGITEAVQPTTALTDPKLVPVNAVPSKIPLLSMRLLSNMVGKASYE